MEKTWKRLSWPQVAALAIVIAGVVAVWVAVPADKLPPWEVISGLVAILVGGGASAALPALVRPKDGDE